MPFMDLSSHRTFLVLLCCLCNNKLKNTELILAVKHLCRIHLGGGGECWWGVRGGVNIVMEQLKTSIYSSFLWSRWTTVVPNLSHQVTTLPVNKESLLNFGFQLNIGLQKWTKRTCPGCVCRLLQLSSHWFCCESAAACVSSHISGLKYWTSVFASEDSGPGSSRRWSVEGDGIIRMQQRWKTVVKLLSGAVFKKRRGIFEDPHQLHMCVFSAYLVWLTAAAAAQTGTTSLFCQLSVSLGFYCSCSRLIEPDPRMTLWLQQVAAGKARPLLHDSADSCYHRTQSNRVILSPQLQKQPFFLH